MRLPRCDYRRLTSSKPAELAQAGHRIIFPSAAQSFAAACQNVPQRLWLEVRINAGHRPSLSVILEPTSKSFKHDADGGKLYKTEEVGWVVFPANQ